MAAGITAILLIIIVALCAAIAHLRRNRITAVALIVLIGVLAGNAPGTIGDWSQASADWLYALPAAIAEIVA